MILAVKNSAATPSAQSLPSAWPLLGALFAVLFSSTVAAALSGPEKRALDRALADFVGATKAGDAAHLVAMVPAPILAARAQARGESEAEARASAVKARATTAETEKVLFAQIDRSAVATFDLPKAGQVAIVPVDTLVEVRSGERLAVRRSLLGLYRGGAWWMVYPFDPLWKTATSTAFPFVANLMLPAPVRNQVSP